MHHLIIDTGNTAFMLLCSSLPMLMTRRLAFFYGGLVSVILTNPFALATVSL